MAIYLLDTDIIVDVLNGKRNRYEFLLDLTVRQGHLLACCPINVSEVYAGMRSREEARTSALLRSLRLYPLTFEVAELAGLFKRDYANKGVTLSLTDASIAAVAVYNQLTLITGNVKDFPMETLSIFTLPS